MSTISINNLCFFYEGSHDYIFDNLNLKLDTGQRLGLVGRNGRGKTTLLKLLAGKLAYSGTITSNVTFDYFPFEVEADALGAEVVESIVPHCPRWAIVKEFNLLGLDEGCLYRQFGTLSGGEQTKLLLAALFVKPENFLLIDEPTNHLDLETRHMVAKYLRTKSGFVLVSHDRAFLDTCVDHILAIERESVTLMRGNFSDWLADKERRDATELAQNQKLTAEIARLSAAQRRTGTWSDKAHRESRSHEDGFKEYYRNKAQKLDSAVKNLKRRIDSAIESKRNLLGDVERVDELKLTFGRHHSQRLVATRNLSVSYDRPIFEGQNIEINSGERVALLGRSGSGKSTLLKILAGESADYSGEVWRASGLKVSYVPQHADIKGRLKEYALECEVEPSLLLTLLVKLDLEREMFDRDISDFSAGQKKKVLLARSLAQPAHLFVWDEPLNYVDILSRIQIQKLLTECRPTMVFAEHDGAFADAVATRRVYLE